MIEIWKNVDGYDGDYQVSNLGRVRSLKFNKIRILKTPPSKNGYLRVNLMKFGVKETAYIHKLVAIHFIGHKKSKFKEVVDHIDNDKKNNRIDNLQLLTQRQNLSKDKKGTSSYVGVNWHKSSKKWTSSIYVGGSIIYLGLFETEEEASLEYKKKLDAVITESNNK